MKKLRGRRRKTVLEDDRNHKMPGLSRDETRNRGMLSLPLKEEEDDDFLM